MKTNATIFFLLFLTSCKQDVAVDLPPFEEKLVAISYIEEGDSKYLVYINKTIDPHLDNYWNYIDTSFAMAKVMLSIDNVPFELRRMPKSEYHKYISSVHNSYGRFFALDKKVKNITNVKLTMEYQGMKVESECNMLPTPHIENAVLTGTSQSSGYYSGMKVKISANFPAGISLYMIQLIQPSYIVYQDSVNVWYSSQYSTKGYFTSTNTDRNKEFIFSNTSFSSNTNQRNYIIVLTRIEKAYYDFALTSKAQFNETDTFLPTETTEVPSNIRGGYGIFTAMKSDTAKVTLQ